MKPCPGERVETFSAPGAHLGTVHRRWRAHVAAAIAATATTAARIRRWRDGMRLARLGFISADVAVAARLPPPSGEVLEERVLLITVRVPTFKMPPPANEPLLLEWVLFVTSKVLLLTMPPPKAAVLDAMVLSVTVSVPEFSMPPPRQPPPQFPLATVSPCMVAETPPSIRSTRTAFPPLIVTLADPGPAIVSA
ncbi:MAG: hypothetical protein HY329_06710 [Chloroflexi bacterium]|nr:hypothetical protein [Chloroflexota bacterium]